MTLSPDELSDRLEIQDTLVHYSHGLDTRSRESYDLAFTPDAVLDFTSAGLTPAHTPASAWELFTSTDDQRLGGQHLLSNTLITVDGDTATAYSEYTVYRVRRSEQPDRAEVGSGGGVYEDALIRTSDGWRITRRTTITKWHKQETIGWVAPA